MTPRELLDALETAPPSVATSSTGLYNSAATVKSMERGIPAALQATNSRQHSNGNGRGATGGVTMAGSRDEYEESDEDESEDEGEEGSDDDN